jgi:hypothetical protein
MERLLAVNPVDFLEWICPLWVAHGTVEEQVMHCEKFEVSTWPQRYNSLLIQASSVLAYAD